MGTKRPAESELMKERFWKNCKNIWIGPQQSSSATIKCDPARIVHFKPFLKTWVVLHREWGCLGINKEGFLVLVDPSTWAHAFLQFDLSEATAILSQVVFTQDELDARDSKIDLTAKLECLNLIKREAIACAVEWMTNKHQDPWGYDEAWAKINVVVSKTDMLQINQGFLEFEKVGGVRAYLTTSEISVEDNNGGFISGVFKDPSQGNDHDDLMDFVTWNVDLLSSSSDTSLFSSEQVFETVWGLQKVGREAYMTRKLLELDKITTLAGIVKKLTQKTVPDFHEVFSGPVQFDEQQLDVLERKRRTCSFPELVRSGFRMLYRRYNGNADKSDPQLPDSIFVSFREDEQARVILLSIIILLKFVTQFDAPFDETAKKFDEKITGHHVFPTREEMAEVFSVLNEVCHGKFDQEYRGETERTIQSSDGTPLESEIHQLQQPFENNNNNTSHISAQPHYSHEATTTMTTTCELGDNSLPSSGVDLSEYYLGDDGVDYLPSLTAANNNNAVPATDQYDDIDAAPPRGQLTVTSSHHNSAHQAHYSQEAYTSTATFGIDDANNNNNDGNVTMGISEQHEPPPPRAAGTIEVHAVNLKYYYHHLVCSEDRKGRKYVTFKDHGDNQSPIRFYASVLIKTLQIMKDTLAKRNEKLENKKGADEKSKDKKKKEVDEDSREICPEYQGGTFLMTNTFKKEIVLEMRRGAKNSPQGLALTRMLMILQSELESDPNDPTSKFTAQLENANPEQSISVTCANNLQGEIKQWLFSEYPLQLNKKYPEHNIIASDED